MNRDVTDCDLDKNRAFTYSRCRKFEHIFVTIKTFKNVKDSRKFWGILKHKLYACRQRGRVVKSTEIMIDMFLVQNLFTPFCCVFGKDTLRQFFCSEVVESDSKF